MTRQPRSEGDRGATIMWFTLLGLPFIFLGAFLAVDVTRMLVHEQRVATSAQMAAIAGAQQFVEDEARLDTMAAHTAALSTWNQQPTPQGVTINSASPQATPQQVEFHVDYQIEGLGLAAVLQMMFDDDTELGDGHLTRSAAVCTPGDEGGPTHDGRCGVPVPHHVID